MGDTTTVTFLTLGFLSFIGALLAAALSGDSVTFPHDCYFHLTFFIVVLAISLALYMLGLLHNILLCQQSNISYISMGLDCPSSCSATLEYKGK